jgi:hypothetical protein
VVGTGWDGSADLQERGEFSGSDSHWLALTMSSLFVLLLAFPQTAIVVTRVHL